jgi:hypothetical protein
VLGGSVQVVLFCQLTWLLFLICCVVHVEAFAWL